MLGTRAICCAMVWSASVTRGNWGWGCASAMSMSVVWLVTRLVRSGTLISANAVLDTSAWLHPTPKAADTYLSPSSRPSCLNVSGSRWRAWPCQGVSLFRPCNHAIFLTSLTFRYNVGMVRTPRYIFSHPYSFSLSCIRLTWALCLTHLSAAGRPPQILAARLVRRLMGSVPNERNCHPWSGS